MGWQITWEGRTWTEDDLTTAHLLAIVAAQGIDTWEQCDPTAGPARLVGMIAALVAIADHRPIDAVIAEVATSPALLLADAIGPPPEPVTVPEPAKE